MGALTGYKILDFTTLLPGPYATMTLADMGAEVLKVSSKDKYDLVVNWPPVIDGAQVTGTQAQLNKRQYKTGRHPLVTAGFIDHRHPDVILYPSSRLSRT